MGELIPFPSKVDINLVELPIAREARSRLKAPKPKFPDAALANLPPIYRERGSLRIVINRCVLNPSNEQGLLYRNVSENLTMLYHPLSSWGEIERKRLEIEIEEAIGPAPGTRVYNRFISKNSSRKVRLNALRAYTVYAERRSAYLKSKEHSA